MRGRFFYDQPKIMGWGGIKKKFPVGLKRPIPIAKQISFT
jgi:hypothetical protein